MIQAEINKKKIPLTRKFNLGLRKKRLKQYICSIGSYCAEIWRLSENNCQKHLEVLKWGHGEGLKN
jgi:hypothetical protein